MDGVQYHDVSNIFKYDINDTPFILYYILYNLKYHAYSIYFFNMIFSTPFILYNILYKI